MKILTLDQIRADRAALTRDARIRMPSTIERAADKPIRVVVSTGEVDRYNSVINQDGWNLEQYRANPVVLWMHDYSTPTIARSAKIEVNDGRLVAEPVFPERGAFPLADTVHDLVRGGFINAASVGWQADEWTYDEDMGGMRFIRQTLMEWSFVTVPGNAGALVEARSAGIDIDPLKAHAELVLRATGSATAEATARAGDARRVYVFARGDMRIEAPTAKALGRALAVVGVRADEPKDEPKDEAAAEACKCGREYGPDDKFCAACGEKRAEPEPTDTDEPADDDEIDAERVLAAIQRITS